MSPSPLPEAVRSFVRDYITSVEQLEILLLLHRTAPREWTAVAVSRELRLDTMSATRRLADFHERGLLRCRTSRDALEFWYEGTSPERDRIISQLAEAYQDRRTSVLRLVFSTPTDAVRIFADAFRVRRPSDDE